MGTAFLALNASRTPVRQPPGAPGPQLRLDRTKAIELFVGPSLAHLTCQLMPPSMPSYRRYCPYTVGPPDGHYLGPDLDRRARSSEASGTVGTDVDGRRHRRRSTAPVRTSRGPALARSTRPPSDGSPHTSRLLQAVRPRQRSRGRGTASSPTIPLPSTFYDIVACPRSSGRSLHVYCDPRWTVGRRGGGDAPVRARGALRAWTQIDQTSPTRPRRRALEQPSGVADLRAVGNYQKGHHTRPLLSQLWVQ